MNPSFILRKATSHDFESIWQIILQAKERRRMDGSQQWQDGYPNTGSIKSDIEKDGGYVLVFDNKIAAYVSVIFDVEPAYEAIDGKWLTNGKYVVVHRLAVSDEFLGQGIASVIMKEIELIAVGENVYSIKVDTNFDNLPMLKILDKLGYTYCGEVFFRGSPRKAYEKVLPKDK